MNFDEPNALKHGVWARTTEVNLDGIRESVPDGEKEKPLAQGS